MPFTASLIFFWGMLNIIDKLHVHWSIVYYTTANTTMVRENRACTWKKHGFLLFILKATLVLLFSLKKTTTKISKSETFYVSFFFQFIKTWTGPFKMVRSPNRCFFMYKLYIFTYRYFCWGPYTANKVSALISIYTKMYMFDYNFSRTEQFNMNVFTQFKTRKWHKNTQQIRNCGIYSLQHFIFWDDLDIFLGPDEQYGNTHVLNCFHFNEVYVS